MQPFMQESLKRDKHFLDTLLESVNHVRKESPKKRGKQRTNWKIVLEIMQEHFPNRKLTTESLRNRYRRLTDIKVNQITKRRDDKRMGKLTLERRVLGEIKRKRPLTYLVDRLGESEKDILAAVSRLQIQGFRGVAAFTEDGVVYVHNRVRSDQRVPNMAGDTMGVDLSAYAGDGEVTFGVVGDTHFGNMCTDKQALGRFYDTIASRGIKVVLHTGDIVDGYYPNRPTSVLEQYAVGFTEQLKDVVRHYPKREGVQTWGITGNHDSTFMRHGFADIGQSVAMAREDIHYLGHNFGKVTFAKGVSVSLIHPTDGGSKDYNKKMRDIIDTMPERRAELMFVGHYHKLASVKYQGIYGFITPSFEKRTTFFRDSGLDAVVGGLIVTVRFDKKGITSVMHEVITY